jgi:hypothetical protein
MPDLFLIFYYNKADVPKFTNLTISCEQFGAIECYNWIYNSWEVIMEVSRGPSFCLTATSIQFTHGFGFKFFFSIAHKSPPTTPEPEMRASRQCLAVVLS